MHETNETTRAISQSERGPGNQVVVRGLESCGAGRAGIFTSSGALLARPGLPPLTFRTLTSLPLHAHAVHQYYPWKSSCGGGVPVHLPTPTDSAMAPQAVANVPVDSTSARSPSPRVFTNAASHAAWPFPMSVATDRIRANLPTSQQATSLRSMRMLALTD